MINKELLEEVLGALGRCVYVIGHNSCTDGNQPNGFVVALEHGRNALAKAQAADGIHLCDDCRQTFEDDFG